MSKSYISYMCPTPDISHQAYASWVNPVAKITSRSLSIAKRNDSLQNSNIRFFISFLKNKGLREWNVLDQSNNISTSAHYHTTIDQCTDTCGL